LKIIETNLPGCLVIEPKVFDDHRGIFFEGFNAEVFKEKTGYEFNVKQMNCSRSAAGVIRGLHFQRAPYEQAKLVFVTKGEIVDVIVDIRKDSPTFGEHLKIVLSSENRKRIFIPKGFAHGFLSRTEGAELNYLVDELYNAKHDSGILYSDEDLNINWETNPKNVILSEKDRNLPRLKQYVSE